MLIDFFLKKVPTQSFASLNKIFILNVLHNLMVLNNGVLHMFKVFI